jgi:hypothetical protein
MKVLFSGLLIFLFWSPVGYRAALKDNSMNVLTIRIVEATSSGAITVELTNSSKRPVRIWKDSNSWGAARWRVLLIREGQLQTLFENPNQDFTRNIPTFKEIAAGTRLEQKLDLNQGDWLDSNAHSIHFARNDLIVVVYDVPFTPEALKMRVWYGVAAALTTVQ